MQVSDFYHDFPKLKIPFVMNTQQELVEAVRDYQSGRMGEITRTAEVR